MQCVTGLSRGKQSLHLLSSAGVSASALSAVDWSSVGGEAQGAQLPELLRALHTLLPEEQQIHQALWDFCQRSSAPELLPLGAAERVLRALLEGLPPLLASVRERAAETNGWPAEFVCQYIALITKLLNCSSNKKKVFL